MKERRSQMGRCNTPTFCLELPLITDKWQRDILNKAFYKTYLIRRDLYNYEMKKFNLIIENPDYLELADKITSTKDKNKRKVLYKELNALLELNGISKSIFEKDVVRIRHFHNQVHTHIAQRIANSVWQSFEKVFFAFP